MIQNESYVRIIDNSGVILAKVIMRREWYVLNSIGRKYQASILEINKKVSVSKKKRGKRKFEEGIVRKIMIVNQKLWLNRGSGIRVHWCKSEGCMISERGGIYATRMISLLSMELRRKGQVRCVVMALYIH